MDQIFNEVVESENIEQIKKRLLEKIIAIASQSRTDNTEVVSLLKSAIRTALCSTVEYEANYSVQIFEEWSKYYKDVMCSIFESDVLPDFLKDCETVNPDQALSIIRITLSSLKDVYIYSSVCCDIQKFCSDLLLKYSTYPILSSVISIFNEFEGLRFENKYLGYISNAIICCLVIMPFDVGDISNFESGINAAAVFLQTVWSSSEEHRQTNLGHLCTALSSSESRSLCLALVVDKTPLDKVDNDTKKVVDGSSSDALLTIGCKVLDWLIWPNLQYIHLWILSLFHKIAAAKLFSVLTAIFEAKIEEVMTLLFDKRKRMCALKVAKHMLLSYQVSSSMCQKTAVIFPALIEKLKSENSENNKYDLDAVSVICHYLIYVNPGFPELCENVSDRLKDLKIPCFYEVQTWLRRFRWSSCEPENSCFSKETSSKRIKTKVIGLENFGGISCYVNSVIQALYMTESFCSRIMELAVNAEKQKVTLQLQHVFANLMFSERRSYSPHVFVNVSRPSWFYPIQQQDCSEFLRYLLNTLSIEENNVKSSEDQKDTVTEGFSVNTETIVDKVFAGKLQISYKCLNCTSCSVQNEDFVDLAIPVPRPNGIKVNQANEDKIEVDQANEDNIEDDQANGDKMEVDQSSVIRMEVDQSSGDKIGTDNVNQTETTDTSYNLNELIENYFRPEKLTDENQYFCETCQSLQNGERRVTVSKLSTHLIITLLRFAYSSATSSREKITQEVTYPYILTLPSNCFKNEVGPVQYHLYAIIMHSGNSCESGHYYTFAKENYTDDICGEKCENWYCYNDHIVTLTTLEKIMSLNQHTSMDTGYMLFYKKELMSGEKISQTLGISRSFNEEIMKDNIKCLLKQEGGFKIQRKRTLAIASSAKGFDGPNPPPGGWGSSAG